MAFVLEKGAQDVYDVVHESNFTAASFDNLFAALSARLIQNPKYRLPGNENPFQTTIVVHGGAVFVKLLKSRETTLDIDYLAGYTDALLEDQGLGEAIQLISKEIVEIGKERGLGDAWMNFVGDGVIGRIGEGVEFNDGEEFDVINLIGAQSVMQGVILYQDPGLKVYAMEWCWAFCRKLDRFNEKDRDDIVALLYYLNHSMLPTAQKGDTKGASEQLWTWIEKSCPLQVADWRVRNLEERIKDKILQVAEAFAK